VFKVIARFRNVFGDNCVVPETEQHVASYEKRIENIAEQRIDIINNQQENALTAFEVVPETAVPVRVSDFLESRNISYPDRTVETAGTFNDNSFTPARQGSEAQTVYSTRELPTDDYAYNVLGVQVEPIAVRGKKVELRAAADSNTGSVFIPQSSILLPGQSVSNLTVQNKEITFVPVNLTANDIEGNVKSVIGFYNAQANGAATFSYEIASPVSLPGSTCSAYSAVSLPRVGSGITLYVFPGTNAAGAASPWDGKGVSCNSKGTIAHEIGHILGLGHNDCGVGQGTTAGNVMISGIVYDSLPPITTGQKYKLHWIKDQPAECGTSSGTSGGAGGSSGSGRVPIPTGPAGAPPNSFPISSTGIPSNPNYGSNPNRDSIIKNTALVCPSSLTAQRGSVISVPVSALGNNYIGIYLTVKSRVRAGESAAESSSPGIRASSDPTKAGTNLFPGSQANLEVEIGSDVSGGSAQLVIEGYIQAYTGDKTAEGDPKDQFPIYLGCAVNINISGDFPRGTGASLSVAGKIGSGTFAAGSEVSVTWYIPRSYSLCTVYAGSPPNGIQLASNVYEMNDTSAIKAVIAGPMQFIILCYNQATGKVDLPVATFMATLGNQLPGYTTGPNGLFVQLEVLPEAKISHGNFCDTSIGLGTCVNEKLERDWVNPPNTPSDPLALTVRSGSNVVVRWRSGQAKSCEVTPMGWTGLSGSAALVNIQNYVTIRVTCTNEQGQSVSAQQSVSVIGGATADPTGATICQPGVTIIPVPNNTPATERSFTVNMVFPNGTNLAGATTSVDFIQLNNNPRLEYRSSAINGSSIAHEFRMFIPAGLYKRGVPQAYITVKQAGKTIGFCEAGASYDYEGGLPGDGNPLLVNPSNVEVAVGQTKTVKISGGTTPYLPNDSLGIDPTYYATTRIEGDTLYIKGERVGSVVVGVKDSLVTAYGFRFISVGVKVVPSGTGTGGGGTGGGGSGGGTQPTSDLTVTTSFASNGALSITANSTIAGTEALKFFVDGAQIASPAGSSATVSYSQAKQWAAGSNHEVSVTARKNSANVKTTTITVTKPGGGVTTQEDEPITIPGGSGGTGSTGDTGGVPGGAGVGSGSGGNPTPVGPVLSGCTTVTSGVLTLSCDGASVSTDSKVRSITVKLNGAQIAYCEQTEDAVDKGSLSCPINLNIETRGTYTLTAKADIRLATDPSPATMTLRYQ
jgi:hypothetical protein